MRTSTLLTLAPSRRPTAGPLLLALALVLASPRAAEAQSVSDRAAIAQGLYDSAAELIKAGRFAEACPKLEESQRLDPAMGTQFFLASCYEKTGRPTRAWSLFLELAALAKAAGNVVRESTARGRAAALEPKLPRLTVVIVEATARLPGLTVLRDGMALKPVVWGSAIPVDLGEHTILVTAPGKAPWETMVTVQELGQRVEVRVPSLLDPLHDGDAPAPRAAIPVDAGVERASNGLPAQRIAALVAGSAGVAGLAVGGVLGLQARAAWKQADVACPTHLSCSAVAHDQSARSLSLATGSTVAFAAGGAAVAGALVLWFTTPSPRSRARLQVVPIAGAGAVGALATGAF